MDQTTTGALPEAAQWLQAEGDAILCEPSDQFVSTPFVRELTQRALWYLEAGFPIHFAGPAGTGKTTLAFHVAARLGRPVMLIHGDDEFGSSDLVGREAGYRRFKLVDNFIHSVLKTQEEARTLWVDNRLTTACQRGYTLVYDEFNRSRPEANNVLLSILSENILNLPRLDVSARGYLRVHPQFRAIFTSNPEEYAGTHRTQDALRDRLVTLRLGPFDRETEVLITRAKSGISQADAELIVDIVRELREIGVNNHRPTVRACITIAKILAHQSAMAEWEDPTFRSVCRDALAVDTIKVTRDGDPVMEQKVEEVLREVCQRRKL